MMNKFEALTQIIKNKEADLIAEIDDMLIEAGMQAFVLWAKAFPKRGLRFVSGMGTATFGAPSLDNNAFLLELDDYCESNTKKTYWSNRAAAMVQPMVDFWELFWCGDFYKYPAIPDILYNPITRTVECGDKIIYLDK
jgi:hypothetical protein